MKKHLTRLGMGVITTLTLVITLTNPTSTTDCKITHQGRCIQVVDVDSDGHGWGYLDQTPINFWDNGTTIETY